MRVNRNLKATIAALLTGLAALSTAAPVDLIVRLARRTDANYVATKYRVPLIDRTAAAPFALYRAKSPAQATQLMAKMALDKRIVWVEEDDEYTTPEDQGLKGAPYKGSTLPAVGDRSVLYKGNKDALAQISFDQNAAATLGRRVRVAIIDTGLSPSQSYLWAKTDYSVNFVEPGIGAFDVERQRDTNGDGVKDGAVGHGTMVAGVIDQIAPQSRFTIVRIADSDGIGTAWNLIKGLAYAVATGCEVANVSMGSQNDLPAMSDVMDWCEQQNLLVVASAGNNNADKVAFPARIRKVVSVGGLMPDNTKAPFSNYEGRLYFSTPATGIISQWHDGRIGVWSGTSFAAPMVTGAIVDGLKRTNVRQNVGVLRDRIEKVGDDLNRFNPQFKDELGKLLNVKKIAATISGGA